MISSVSGGFNAAPQSATDEEQDYQDMILLGRRGGPFSQRRRARSLFLNGFLLGLICIGIQGIYIKLINHCQAVMIKQQITFKEC